MIAVDTNLLGYAHRYGQLITTSVDSQTFVPGTPTPMT